MKEKKKPLRAWWERLWRKEGCRAWIPGPWAAAGEACEPWFSSVSKRQLVCVVSVLVHGVQRNETKRGWELELELQECEERRTNEEGKGFCLCFSLSFYFTRLWIFEHPTEINSKFADFWFNRRRKHVMYVSSFFFIGC